jgi:polysaccharide export outer membrane protein
MKTTSTCGLPPSGFLAILENSATAHRDSSRPLTTWFLSVGLRALALLCASTAVAQDGAVVSRNSSYVLLPGDMVHIKVFQEDDLESQLRIAKDGTITFPLLGQVRIGGMTVAQAADTLATRLRDGYLVSPQVSITIVSYSARRFVVLGQVQKPGSYELPTEQTITLLEAIAMAGGYTRIADPGKVMVRRTDATGERVYRINAKQMARDGSVEQFEIRPNDTITVSESLF